VPRIKIIPSNEHIYADGMTFKNLRDAIVAASKAGMWHISHEMAARYQVADILCLSCGKPNTDAQAYTYFTHQTMAIKICLSCNRDRSLRLR